MPERSWVIDEAGHAGEHHLQPGYVDGYDRKAGFDPAPELEVLVERGLHADSCLVDLGGGTGELALAAARVCRRVVLVDVSRSMVDAARGKAARSGLTNVTTVVAGFLDYRHEGELADAVYTRNALHHLPDFWKVLALRRIASILKPGGVLRLVDLVYHCEPGDVDRVIQDWIDAAPPGPAAVGWSREELEQDVRDEHITFSWLLELMLERTGFRVEDAYHRDPRPYASYVCTLESPPPR
ncbi:MAG: class I SAM-dependent methyltransferase [Candidatus Dormibacteraeota bacterium]|nr:class I SAM-dependent methyltransferase [Candidatus Dormibacteraeota bacterium]